jgi:hypothetical protein
MAIIGGVTGGVTLPGNFDTVSSLISASNMTVPQSAAIQGKMITVNHVINDIEWAQRVLTPEEIKMRLTELMVQEIYKNNCIEFTKQVNMASGDHLFHARIFVVPDTQVRILRENKFA